MNYFKKHHNEHLGDINIRLMSRSQMKAYQAIFADEALPVEKKLDAIGNCVLHSVYNADECPYFKSMEDLDENYPALIVNNLFHEVFSVNTPDEKKS
jgi:hypothetical protein